MIIPQELYDKWKVLRSHGDAIKIMELAFAQGIECSDEMINRAIRSGKCNDDIFPVMAAFYKEREELIKEYL